MRALPLLLLLVPACSATPEPGKLLDFVPPKPGEHAPACVDANAGKRFIVEGHVGPGGGVTVDNGLVGLDVAESYADGDVAGKSFSAEFKDDTHVKFDVANQKAKNVNVFISGSEGDLKGVTLKTTTGDATPADKLAVVFDYEVIKHFQTGQITACVAHVVELRRL